VRNDHELLWRPGAPGTDTVDLVLVRPVRVPVFLDIAREANCGLINNTNIDGALELYAEDVRHMMDFARLLVARRHSLPGLKSESARPAGRRRPPVSCNMETLQLSLPVE
jgi:hypothetical protein